MLKPRGQHSAAQDIKRLLQASYSQTCNRAKAQSTWVYPLHVLMPPTTVCAEQHANPTVTDLWLLAITFSPSVGYLYKFTMPRFPHTWRRLTPNA